MITTSRSALLADEEFTRFRDLMRERAGVVIPNSRRAEVERLVFRTLEDHDLRTPEALYRHLVAEEGRSHLEGFLGSLTVGETHFFRNRAQFEALEEVVLPGLIERRRSSRRLRIWSAACSTGEEAYSVAMQVKRLLPNPERWKVTILATDINLKAIDRARRGNYGSWSFREVPDRYIADGFAKRNDSFEVLPEIREMVTFEYLNLIEDSYPSLHTNTLGMDLILCRNVLMYFDEASVRKVAGRLHACLNDDGWLVVAPVESSQEIFTDFTSQNFPGAVLYRKPVSTGEPGPVTAPAAPPPVFAPSPAVSPLPFSPPPSAVAAQSEAATIDPAEPAPGDLTQPGEIAPFVAAKDLAGRLELVKAEELIEESISHNPLWGPAHYLKGLILLEDNRPEEALGAVRRCVFADPGFILGHYLLGTLFIGRGRLDRASKAFGNAIALMEDADRDEEVPEGDGLTIGRLRELIGMQREMLPSPPAGGR